MENVRRNQRNLHFTQSIIVPSMPLHELKLNEIPFLLDFKESKTQIQMNFIKNYCILFK